MELLSFIEKVKVATFDGDGCGCYCGGGRLSHFCCYTYLTLIMIPCSMLYADVLCDLLLFLSDRKLYYNKVEEQSLMAEIRLTCLLASCA